MKPSSALAISCFVLHLRLIAFGSPSSRMQPITDRSQHHDISPAQLTQPLEAVAVAVHQASLYQEVGHAHQKRDPSDAGQGCLCEG